jgi:hypothetical protein
MFELYFAESLTTCNEPYNEKAIHAELGNA